MKDRLNRAQWWNQPVKNKTQNALMRFQRAPGGEWFDKGFRDSERRFKMVLNKALKTHYSEIMDEF